MRAGYEHLPSLAPVWEGPALGGTAEPPAAARTRSRTLHTAAASAGSVDLGVTAAVLLAAVLHASWNALAHALGDQLVGFALIGTAVTACSVVIVLVVPTPSRASWPFLAGSVVLHVVYTLLLMRCYRLGAFSQVFPVARGTSPWLVALAAAALVGEAVSPARLVGLLVLTAGLATLVLAGGVPLRQARPAVAAAVLTGVVIASYTTLDGLGVRRADSVGGYTGWLFLLQGPALPLLALATRRGRLWHDVRPHLRVGLTGGVLSLAAYALVLWAQTRGALAAVAALRETSVVFGAAIGAFLFHEPFGRRRTAATVLVAAGVVLINL
jgi:drug/metabolite transporter (DMT)-like permease